MPSVSPDPETDTMLTPSEVAQLFGVGVKTVTRWADTGKLTHFRTLGGHRRYQLSEVNALFEDTVRRREA